MTEPVTQADRAPRGSSTPAERAHRAYATLRGLAADVYQAQSIALGDAYGKALAATEELETAFKEWAPGKQ